MLKWKMNWKVKNWNIHFEIFSRIMYMLSRFILDYPEFFISSWNFISEFPQFLFDIDLENNPDTSKNIPNDNDEPTQLGWSSELPRKTTKDKISSGKDISLNLIRISCFSCIWEKWMKSFWSDSHWRRRLLSRHLTHCLLWNFTQCWKETEQCVFDMFSAHFSTI